MMYFFTSGCALSFHLFRFISLFFSGVFLLMLGFYFVLNDLVYFIEWVIVTLN
jgi:hypothetical protein